MRIFYVGNKVRLRRCDGGTIEGKLTGLSTFNEDEDTIPTIFVNNKRYDVSQLRGARIIPGRGDIYLRVNQGGLAA